MEYVTIISKEEILLTPIWPFAIFGAIAIGFLISTVVVQFIQLPIYKRELYTERLETLTLLFMVLMFVAGFISYCICPRETGRYKYEGTFDPDMTMEELYEFYHQYDNVRFEDNVWKWEDKHE